MSISPKLLDILCCPSSHVPLRQLDSKRLQKLNQSIAEQQVENVSHETVANALEEALITQDDKLIYAVCDGIPHLLPNEAIATLQFDQF